MLPLRKEAAKGLGSPQQASVASPHAELSTRATKLCPRYDFPSACSSWAGRALDSWRPGRSERSCPLTPLFSPCSIFDILCTDWEHCGLLNATLLGRLGKKLKLGPIDTRDKSQPAHKVQLLIRLYFEIPKLD